MNQQLVLDDRTLAEARAETWERAEAGVDCPCCDRLVKIYNRKINTTQARGLILMARQADEWLHLPTLVRGGDSGEVSRCAHWGLVDELDVKRDDGGRAGFWRLTAKGRLFVQGRIKVPKYARIYDGECLGLTGDLVSIRDALGTKFNYDDLMRGI
jgi:hypothetical protein